VSSEVLENESSSINKKLNSVDILQGCSQQYHLQKPNDNEIDSSEVNMNLSPSCRAEKDFTARTEIPAVKGSSASSVRNPPFCSTKTNKTLQFSSDSSSDVEAEDDLITSSQGDEDNGRKWYVIDLISKHLSPFMIMLLFLIRCYVQMIECH
jgi:hypothetical protein